MFKNTKHQKECCTLVFGVKLLGIDIDLFSSLKGATFISRLWNCTPNVLGDGPSPKRVAATLCKGKTSSLHAVLFVQALVFGSL